ncbi:MAG: flagellar hook-basal body complex protein FliE [Alphaproteobacteria bacterium]|nr:MAG: flagellar hook-basal body complex protein FliE [Alphaproteobacteria bacterium]
MDVRALDAARAYGANLTRLQEGNASTAGETGEARTGRTGFAQMVESLAGSAVGALNEAERVSALAVAGKADIVDVTTAVANAEMVLETVSTVRDRVIQAYQEIMRMPV